MSTFFLNISNNVEGIVRVDAEPVDPSFRDLTILSGNGTVKAIDGNHNTVWSVPFRALDKEMLPNGNLLVTSGSKFGTSSIREVDIASSSIVWEVSYVDGMPLSFTHDTDWLGVDPFGQDIYLTADTYNDRVVEFFSNGTVIWSWYADDHYSYGNPSENDWTHLNDADRLPDGSTMISIRNFNKVIIVNTTAAGEVLWEYGDYYDDTVLNGPHNPEYTPKGTLLIADSDNHRIIEVNMTTKEIIWNYTPTGDQSLRWPRDADLLPNGNMIICDSIRTGSGRNTIWEINATTKEVVWYHDTGADNYDSDRLDTVLPAVNISSPAATTYDGAVGVTVLLSCDDPWYDEMVYRIYDETSEQWLTTYNVTYEGETEVFLENHHNYTLYAWAEDVVMEGGAYPTSRATVQLEEASVQFNTGLDDTEPEILDETEPEVSNVNVDAEADITFTATVTDDLSGVKQVTLNYVYVNDTGTGNNNVDMTNIEGNVWSVAIPTFLGNTTLTYTITAEDHEGNIITTNEAEYEYYVAPDSSSPELPLTLIVAVLIIASFAVATILVTLYRRRKKDALNTISEFFWETSSLSEKQKSVPVQKRLKTCCMLFY